MDQDEVDLTRHDGLLVDYSKFSDLTKGVLKNANVLREKSLKSPSRGAGVINPTNSRNAYMLSSMRSREGSPSVGGVGTGLSIPPMSARMSSPSGSASNHLVRRKAPPETPQIIQGTGDVGASRISKQRP